MFRYGSVTWWMKSITELRTGLYGMRGIQLSRIRAKSRISVDEEQRVDVVGDVRAADGRHERSRRHLRAPARPRPSHDRATASPKAARTPSCSSAASPPRSRRPATSPRGATRPRRRRARAAAPPCPPSSSPPGARPGARQALLHAGVDEALRHQREESRSAAGDRGRGVHQPLLHGDELAQQAEQVQQAALGALVERLAGGVAEGPARTSAATFGMNRSTGVPGPERVLDRSMRVAPRIETTGCCAPRPSRARLPQRRPAPRASSRARARQPTRRDRGWTNRAARRPRPQGPERSASTSLTTIWSGPASAADQPRASARPCCLRRSARRSRGGRASGH